MEGINFDTDALIGILEEERTDSPVAEAESMLELSKTAAG